MPIKFAGGWSKVEYDDNTGFTSPTEIPDVIADGTTIEFETPVVGAADGGDLPAGKKATINVRSADVTAAVWSELKTAEAQLAKRHFKFTSLETGKNIVIKGVRPRVEPVMTAAGDLSGYKVTGTGFAIVDTDLYAITAA